jgi:hypothetical protein
MKLNKTVLKLAGGLFAVGIAATSLFAGAPSASADGGSPQPFTPVCAGKPDIRFDRVRVENAHGLMVAHIQFSNQGCATKTSFPIAISEYAPSYAQVTKLTLTQPAMAKGESAVQVVVLGPATAETHHLNVALDLFFGGGQMIVESNEYNNFGDLTFQMP